MSDELAGLFSILGDPTRLRILALLAVGESSVQGLADKLDISHSAVSHQLRLLRAYRLVNHRRNGRSVIYAMGDRCVRNLLDAGLSHLEHPEAGEGAGS